MEERECFLREISLLLAYLLPIFRILILGNMIGHGICCNHYLCKRESKKKAKKYLVN